MVPMLISGCRGNEPFSLIILPPFKLLMINVQIKLNASADKMFGVASRASTGSYLPLIFCKLCCGFAAYLILRFNIQSVVNPVKMGTELAFFFRFFLFSLSFFFLFFKLLSFWFFNYFHVDLDYFVCYYVSPNLFPFSFPSVFRVKPDPTA